MAMADESDASRIVTAFLLNTCRLPPWPSEHHIEAAMICGEIVTGHSDNRSEFIPLLTGSVAEFYIEPMLLHVGDIDVMYHADTKLAIPEGYPPPTQLPAEFHNHVKVHEILDSHFPGYVSLELRYLLTRRTDNGTYEFTEYERGRCLSRVMFESDKFVYLYRHGPSWRYYYDDVGMLPLSLDTVYCLHCLSWPPQAGDWPTRHRNHDWPDSATLDRVVNNGCDVVGVAHHQCRQYSCMGAHEWRLSFSRAEIVLINSWMPVQQIAYHILRVYVKTERLTENVDNSEPATVSNYHIKTLMLWACELKPRSWWTENLNLVRICAELLNTLSVWLSDTRCPHYFVNNCNLLDTSLSNAEVTSKLMYIDETYLSTWLINNYIAQCAQLCPSYISRLFDDVSTSLKLQKAVSAIVDWRLNNLEFDLWKSVEFVQMSIQRYVLSYPLTVRSCEYLMKELTKIDKRFCVYFSAVALLYVARKISQNGLSDKLMDILSTILGCNFSQYCSILSRCEIELNTSELVEILEESAVEQLTTCRQLEVRDCGSRVTVTTDFEALYAYKLGDYQRCLQMSTQNACTLSYTRCTSSISVYPEFVQLLDDDIVSLIALMQVINPDCKHHSKYTDITQLTLSLYLMTQCQLKLHHSVTSLAQTLNCIEVAQRRPRRRHSYRSPMPTHVREENTLDLLALKLIERKAHLAILHAWHAK